MASRKFERPFNRETVSNTAETSQQALLQVRGSDGRYPGDDERDKAKLKSICSFALIRFPLQTKVGRVKRTQILELPGMATKTQTPQFTGRLPQS